MTEKTRPSAAPTSGSDEIDIGRLVGTVVEAKWWVLGITAVFAAAAGAVAVAEVFKAMVDAKR